MGDALTIDAVTLRFGGLVAVDAVSFAVPAGSITAVIGPNGAGKTSLFNVVTGLYRPQSGRTLVDGREVVAPPGSRLAVVAVSIAAGLGAAVAMNCIAVWQALCGDASALHATAWPWFAGPALAGSFCGGAATAVAQARARRGPEVAARLGLARTFQNLRLFRELPVIDNVVVACDARAPWWSGLAAVFGLPSERRRSDAARAEARSLLAVVGLEDAALRRAGDLPYGHQRRLEIARALAVRPRVLLLDEPAAGMNPAETADLMRTIRSIRDRGVTVVLIEHDMRLVMEVSERIVVLHHGAKLAEGTPAEVRRDPRVVEAYLGAHA